MSNVTQRMATASNISNKVNSVFQGRLQTAQERFNEHTRKAYEESVASLMTRAWTPWDIWTNWMQYSTDFAQRSLLFWDTMRKRGNNFVAHEQAGKPPLLHFQYEIVLDARSFARPVNYALLRILPPEGVTTDLMRRPYIIIDPRAGHGPGIGGFKDDSQVGVALRDGHPVYFVMFRPEPEPGQTLLDVCAAEQKFVRKVRKLHPNSPKPVIIGNCQGGWAAMMLAASDPEDTGPIVINGAPMSYWSGAWSDGEGNNPMRYSGGLLGGSWLSSLTADLGNGRFDGAFLVQNFENLNPANTFWEKYYHLFANIDTERNASCNSSDGGEVTIYSIRARSSGLFRTSLSIISSGPEQRIPGARCLTCAGSNRRSFCLHRWATTSPRHNKRSIGWRMFIVPQKKLRPPAR